ncbi:hypothetical protein BS78_03G411900 [Paspalum vaginatum]|nr:hypothetical protein BS78_03G411900 [Paspalum vaginatum]
MSLTPTRAGGPAGAAAGRPDGPDLHASPRHRSVAALGGEEGGSAPARRLAERSTRCSTGARPASSAAGRAPSTGEPQRLDAAAGKRRRIRRSSRPPRRAGAAVRAGEWLWPAAEEERSGRVGCHGTGGGRGGARGGGGLVQRPWMGAVRAVEPAPQCARWVVMKD